MKFKDLLSALPEFTEMLSQQLVAEDLIQQEVDHIAVDHRKANKKSVFVAIKGNKIDSHDYLQEVVQQGTQAIVFSDPDKLPKDYSGIRVHCTNTRIALDLLASRFYGDPSRFLLMFGVTGTNGKTSSTYLIEHIFNASGFPTGVIGTINHHLQKQIWSAETTTPGPLELQARLHQMKELGAKVVAMEVSSHALHQHRLDSVHFNTVMFTNLTQDHLDYHSSMADYFLAKQRLFSDLMWSSCKVPQFAIINTDDPWGKKMRVAGYSGIWSYGQKKSADFHFTIKSVDFTHTEFVLNCPFGQFHASLPICGLHNVYNTVGAVAAAASMGIPVLYSLSALKSFAGVPGRLQSVPNKKNLHVFIDYAHTPDALENVLSVLNKIRDSSKTRNKIISVFGCGGDRDKGKRPLMAQAAEKLSDMVILTSDNPRTEDPRQIIDEIANGFQMKTPIIEADRKKAIHLAIQSAVAGDVILIAGKGHEDYQIIGDEKKHFSDFEVSSEGLQ